MCVFLVVQGCGSQVFNYCTEIPLDKGGPQIQPLWLPTPQPGDSMLDVVATVYYCGSIYTHVVVFTD